MKVGDLVKVKHCGGPDMENILGETWTCECFFCAGDSNRVGVVIGPAQRNSWAVMFDCGIWRLDDFEEARGEVEVLSKAVELTDEQLETVRGGMNHNQFDIWRCGAINET